VSRYDAVLFDLDNTICRSLQSGDALYAAAFEHAGVRPFGEASALWSVLDGDPDPDPEAAESSLADGFAALAAAHGREDAPVRELARGLLAAVDHSRVAFRPGAEAALELARRNGETALVTNGPERRQAVKLSALGIAEAFDAVVYAGDLPNRKPHPDPFDRAFEALEAERERTVHVGDSLEYDVAGAINAGLDVAWCPTAEGADPGDYRPTHVLRSLRHLRDVIDG
jgi:putative hydrolase of the HAD superfamily